MQNKRIIMNLLLLLGTANSILTIPKTSSQEALLYTHSGQAAITHFKQTFNGSKSNYAGVESDLRDALLAIIESNPHVKLYFDNANLPHMDFSGMKLRHVSFINANLSQANLTRADIKGTNLTGANLSNATLLETKTNRDTNVNGAQLPLAPNFYKRIERN